ncbi:hypothetical protein BU26DRAFT_294130 [Trematosphaeria pertusa]|uniref:Membrane anchor Opy2 N-terminal domain-containing protein n=1 Tax=Trematosphaeria pertusa TaxID=390896 RepID=A0A6A6IIK5_9PLEO|nr:uncharacterized protein BU26DRAFT_294130 [Trematosphaeria pertusa]KAF2250007.1 hypothetical protein BU26DRAFT_294130 [Trematosphaeria pertusa]
MAAFTKRDVENVMRTIFRRCIECDKGTPSCAGVTCPSNQICVQIPPSCNVCSHVDCRPDPAVGGSASSNKPNVGAIAGGVVGGVAFIAILVFVIWKFCLKGKRQPYQEGEWQEVDMAAHEKGEIDFVSRRSTRASTHTVASMASSVLTRASNIIQIAYIPGVTNRSGPGSPDLLVPPVPPIPAMSPSSGLSSPYADSEQHFFVPDFRDSMVSSTTDGRSSYARTSIAPSLARGSVASTVYRQNAIVSPLPAQTIVRGKAAVVSVKSSGSNSPAETPSTEAPPVPQIDPKHTGQPIRIQMPRMMSGSSVSSQSSIRSIATLGPVRALNITKKKATEVTTPKRSPSNASAKTSSTSTSETLVPPMRPLTEISVASTDDGVAHARARRAADVESDSESDDDDHSRARRSLLPSGSERDSDITEIQDTPGMLQSPFSDSSTIDRPDLPQRHTSRSSALRAPMTPIAEESKRASSASKRTQSPFSDDNRSDLG